MSHHYRKMSLVMSRINRARNVVCALKLAGLTDARSRHELDWADLMKTLEAVLPTNDELAEAVAEMRADGIDLSERPEGSSPPP